MTILLIWKSPKKKKKREKRENRPETKSSSSLLSSYMPTTTINEQQQQQQPPFDLRDLLGGDIFSSSFAGGRFLKEREGLRERFIRAMNFALNTGVLSGVVQVELTECKNFLLNDDILNQV
mmetsp:Transcript_30104/g.46100  ORF Transcript_30104/g.46100 Transcript_30104/m.46100 type:complete len:121 (-) Transcript_30104:579-941(-)